MDDQNKNLILATALSFLVILGWYVGGPILFPDWFPTQEVAQPAKTTDTPLAATPPVAGAVPADTALATAPAAAVPEAPRAGG